MARILRLSVWLALGVGLLLQLWLGDRHVLWALLFYMLPKPCLVGLAFLQTVLTYQRSWQQKIASTLMICLTIWWTLSSWRPVVETPSHGAGAPFTLLYWNLCRPAGLDEEAVALVQAQQPDLAVFLEAGKKALTLKTEYEKRLPGYSAQITNSDFLLLSRSSVKIEASGQLARRGAFARVLVQHDGRRFPIVVTDVHPALFYPRGPQLDEALARGKDQPDAILVGDFNTPLESCHFEAYREQFSQVLDIGSGSFRETWPFGLPLLSLDQVWIGSSWQVHKADKIWNLLGSDHAAISVELGRK